MSALLINMKDDLKDELFKKAKEKGVSAAEYMRQLLQEDLKNKKYSSNPFKKAIGFVNDKNAKGIKGLENISSNIDNIIY